MYFLDLSSRKYSEFFISTPNEMRSQEERGRFYLVKRLINILDFFDIPLIKSLINDAYGRLKCQVKVLLM